MAETKTDKIGLPLPAITVGVWAAVLIIAFLANRGDDVGQIGQLFGNLGGGRLGRSGVADSLFGALTAAAIAFAWFGAGNFILSYFPAAKRSEGRSHVLEFSMKTGVGAAVWSLIWFCLGVAGL